MPASRSRTDHWFECLRKVHERRGALEITIDRVRGGVWKFNGVARVGDEVACEAQLMCTMRNVGG